MEKYVANLIEALHPFGDVLEVGFTEASNEIEKYHPKSHTIIVPEVGDALKWAKNHRNVKIVEDIWPNALSQLGVFDTVYFGIDPHGSRLFQKMRHIRYTDHDLELFCHDFGALDKKQISRFLAELEQNNQITAEQKERMVKKHHLPKESPPPAKRSDQMLQFLKRCLVSHMRKGSRFSCYLESELDEPQFFDEIVVDPNLDCRERGRIIVIEKLV